MSGKSTRRRGCEGEPGACHAVRAQLVQNAPCQMAVCGGGGPTVIPGPPGTRDNCAYSPWQAWGPCSATCDAGTHVRYRRCRCSAPTPSLGNPCEDKGPAIQRQTCFSTTFACLSSMRRDSVGRSFDSRTCKRGLAPAPQLFRWLTPPPARPAGKCRRCRPKVCSSLGSRTIATQ